MTALSLWGIFPNLAAPAPPAPLVAEPLPPRPKWGGRRPGAGRKPSFEGRRIGVFVVGRHVKNGRYDCRCAVCGRHLTAVPHDLRRREGVDESCGSGCGPR